VLEKKSMAGGERKREAAADMVGLG